MLGHKISWLRQLEIKLLHSHFHILESGSRQQGTDGLRIGKAKGSVQSCSYLRAEMVRDRLHKLMEVGTFSNITPEADSNAATWPKNAVHLRQSPWSVLQKLERLSAEGYVEFPFGERELIGTILESLNGSSLDGGERFGDIDHSCVQVNSRHTTRWPYLFCCEPCRGTCPAPNIQNSLARSQV